MIYLKKDLPIIISALLLALVVYKIPAPETINFLSFPTLLLLFIPMFSIIFFLINIFTTNKIKNIAFCLTLILGLTFKALGIHFLIILIFLIITTVLILKLKKPLRKVRRSPL